MIVSLTIVRYKKIFIPMALFAMAIHRLPLMLNRKCRFWKLLGTGKNGTFDLNPDWQQWGLLAVWENLEDFKRFESQSFIKKWWRQFCVEQWTVLCEPLQSHGKWDGDNPFVDNNKSTQVYNGPVGVLTRATIRFNRLKNFWAEVAGVADLMKKAPGYITSVGIGEAPVYRQATFSFWQTEEQMKAFAYKSREHADVIKKTRNENWYSEELFARFKPLAIYGTINGVNPLKNIITNENYSRTSASGI
ncbi:DUF3291 domain-containing protein [Mucilaginibacter roseus]|uniref:DUF3291 domain-containing protein n=1 Tax=Mucilaginibacter roseus TaxID=1528868 RepID=A0ABS8TY74_9SPHI|nr:DUF3291 domain-containing protein [Mucilaginibacter roseus]MCD8739828.1 DUF3291 domain-containing protein [Mucilaginibacter roseus]